MRSPVLFLLFNRPETTFRVFEAIRAARPPRLYIAADGPRSGKDGEAKLCEQARAVARMVDWPCEVKTLFRKRNLGCCLAVSSAVTWFFSQEEEGIILEDDVLPHQDFFFFCDTLLEQYRDDPRVMQISGNNFQFGLRRGDGSYYFSAFAHIWGWATWARAWKHFDISMPGVRSYIQNGLAGVAREFAGFLFFARNITEILHNRLDSWAFRWSYCIMKDEGLCINPNINLVKNIGFSGGAHYTGEPCIWERLDTGSLGDITHPSAAALDNDADDFTCRAVFAGEDERLEALAHECLHRIKTGDAHANIHLLRVMRDFYGDCVSFDYLDALTTAALGDGERALEKAESIVRNAPETLDIRELYRRIRLLALTGGALRRNAEVA